MEWLYDDGGREAAGFRGDAGDCGTRAVAIATGQDYRVVYDALAELNGKSVRDGTPRKVMDAYLIGQLGWRWVATMGIGTGARVHLDDGELPEWKPVIARCSKHYVAVMYGVIHDTYDPSRDGTRCVYGYWTQGH